MLEDLASFVAGFIQPAALCITGGIVLAAWLVRALFLTCLKCADGPEIDAGTVLRTLGGELCAPFGASGAASDDDGGASGDAGSD